MIERGILGSGLEHRGFDIGKSPWYSLTHFGLAGMQPCSRFPAMPYDMGPGPPETLGL